MTSQTWTNDDGLQVPFGQDQARDTTGILGKTVQNGPQEYQFTELEFDKLPGFTADLNNDGTLNGFSDSDVYIPAGSLITNAFILVETAFTAGGAATLDIGLAQQDGTVIDADGLFTVISIAQFAAGLAVIGDGALVGPLPTPALVTVDAYLTSTVATGPYTAGKGRLIIEYLQVTP